MSVIEEALTRLRASDRPSGVVGPLAARWPVEFTAVGGPLEERWHQAVRELAACVGPLAGSPPVLAEGGPYPGAWLESTGTISAEVLARFAPDVATDTFTLYATHQRADGLMPYKVTADGPAFSQIQLVSPLARSVWHHYRRGHVDRPWLRMMYDAMAAYDAWLAEHRDTRRTGGVEAFCTFDTGHDLSPRFWFVPDRCHHDDAARYDPDVPTLPFVAPDLTANVACQRRYLALIAGELGLDPAPWQDRAARSAAVLMEQCFDTDDVSFFDRDARGDLVRVRSDVLLRVLACDVVDDDLFLAALRAHVMRTSRFLSHYGFTSIAMDDPRFDADYTRNSWAGPVNLLTQLRVPHAFERHGHPAELALVTVPLLSALARADRFPQCVDGWSGHAGFTSTYSPAILWFLDAVERLCGVLPTPEGTVLVSGLPPTRLGHDLAAQATAYGRTVAGRRVEVAADDERVEVHLDGAPLLTFPRGWRVELTADGEPVEVVGLAPRPTAGELAAGGSSLSLSLAPNERVRLDGATVTSRRRRPFVPPRH